MPHPFLDTELDRQITATHERFVQAMTARLPAMASDSKERYFGLLSVLVGKLEHGDKPLREVLQEMMSEAAPLLLLELGS